MAEPARKKYVKRRNVKRYRENQLRAFGGSERTEWIKAQPCVVRYCHRPSENAHVAPKSEAGGTSRKADAKWIVPMCRQHHRVELHNLGRETFEATYGIDLTREAIAINAIWEEFAA